MAGHSKWANIRHRKGIEDKKRGKIFTKHARLIASAARLGADPEMNPLLRAMIDNAKAENVPNDNIERAIKKGSGEGKNGAVYEEIVYEGMAPGGVALMIEVLTDNRNRAVGDLRVVMNKKGGRLAEANSVSWMFKKVGKFKLGLGGRGFDVAELELIDLGVEEIWRDGDWIAVICAMTDFALVLKKIVEAGFEVVEKGLVFEASNKVEVDFDSLEGKQLMELVEAVEDLDDVSAVYWNVAD